MKKFNIKFYENRKIYFGITIALFAIGIIFNIIFGTTLDIQFKGGAMLDYTYTGEISTSDVESIVEDVTGQNVDIRVYSSMVDTNGANTNGMSITFAGTDSITVDQQDAISSAILEKYPDSALTVEETSSVDRTVCADFDLYRVPLPQDRRRVGWYHFDHCPAARRPSGVLYLCDLPDADQR